MELEKLNLKNKTLESNIVSISVIFANTWMTLISPVMIGLFISKLYSAESHFTNTESGFTAIAIIIHVALALILYQSGSRHSNSVEIDKLIQENKHLKNEVIPKAAEVYNSAAAQQIVVYLMTLELESLVAAINEKDNSCPIDERWDDWKKGLGSIMLHLAKHRVPLFGYTGDSLYNIALYLHNKESDELFIMWRMHDDRLSTSDRRWKPGMGHVGLAFIQQEAKICHDIFQSTELANSSTNDPSDQHKYRSFLSIPITDSFGSDSGKRPLGVLVFTSSSAGQFDWERDKIFTLTVVKLLSIYIERNVIAWAGVENEQA
ncbi:GAF domain-containing protein [Pseudomonas syringae]|uniref:GAF domain-containing protein n=1 Tax=Pseudomonas syringae TaxID=317 RepID=UPI001F10ADDC|nr:GAF domain-containing protein [Pseudomonas syringae]MCH5508864.1 GAF domain-containing protein [Pseudomonas syringae pv. syringae]MCH5518970.1 GAF domain-containing protein [Pseudomonas syringae pv. lapsa]MCH5637633.1 GAF domain-containing protein [Pseudomonas syringae pv. syringae]MCH7426766.1 GAF domain-containing protein [Pseudomonas syringae pv. syringae]